MRWTILLLGMTGLLLAADPPSGEANQKDLERLQGDWAAVSMTRDGQKVPDDDAQSLFRNVKGDQYTVFLFKKAIGKGSFKLDATAKPKAIDFLPASAPAKSQPLLGIDEFDGDTWKVCYAPSGKEWPKEFAAKEGSGHTLAVWEPEKK